MNSGVLATDPSSRQDDRLAAGPVSFLGSADAYPHSDKPGDIREIMAALLSVSGTCPHSECPATASLRRALSLLDARPARFLYRSASADAPVKGGLTPRRMLQIRHHIEETLDGTIHVYDLAALAQLSVRHFSTAFKQSFGSSPHAYIVRRRIARAQKMMLTTAEPLSQIALACGLADQAHLSKWFRRLVGVTPNAWRMARQGER